MKLREEITAWLLKPPYDGVIWLTWIYVVFASLVAGGGPFAGDLIWFDDRVRLVQIFDWLNGQPWHDRTIMRANAPEGFHTIWSRVVDLPNAGIIAALQGSLGQMHAAMVASIIMPLIEALLLMFAATYFVRPLVGKKYAKLVVLFVLFTSALNPEFFTLAGFQVGMVGHHGWYVLLTLMLFGAIARLIMISDIRHVIVGGLAIGGLLTIGIEGFPLIAGACSLLGILGWLHNRPRLAFDAARATFLGAITGLATLPANQPADKWLTISYAEPSILGPILMLAATIFLTGAFLVVHKWGDKRSFIAIVLVSFAVTIAAFLIYLFPALVDGPAAALSPQERRLASNEHAEAISIFRLARDFVETMRFVVPPLMAGCFALWLIDKTRQKKKLALYFYYLGILAVCFLMTAAYSRYFHYLGLSLSPWLLLCWLTMIRALPRNEFFALKSFALYFAICPLWLWLVPAANDNVKIASALLFPAKRQLETDACGTQSLTEFLDARYGADKNIMTPMYYSDRFLLHTHLHIFFLANFPSHNKFVDARSFYRTTSLEEARKIIADHGIDLVTVCSKSFRISPHTTLANRLFASRMSVGQYLTSGQHPAWLKPVEIEGYTSWLLFEVDKKKVMSPDINDNSGQGPVSFPADQKAGSHDIAPDSR